MADKQILKYIQETLADGFDEASIMAELVKSGWEKNEIDEAFAQARGAVSDQTNESPDGFFVRYRKSLIVLIVILVILPLLAYGGLWAYQNYFNQPEEEPEETAVFEEEEETEDPTEQTQTTEPKIVKDELAVQRDKERLEDIAGLQVVLDQYLTDNQSYPPSLNILTEEEYILALPTDPLSGESYVYTASAQAPKFYSIAFILETEVGPLDEGLNVASSESKIDLDMIFQQEEVVEGRLAQNQSEQISITDLSIIPFYPHEEVVLEVKPKQGVDIEYAFLLIGPIKLTDQKAPFRFSFSAPEQPGGYTVNVFGFDSRGNSYFQTTTLTVAK